MVDGAHRGSSGEPDRPTAPEPEVELYESGLARPVLIEVGNSDGWIESDLTVAVER